MNAKPTFNNVSWGHRVAQLIVKLGLVRWTEDFMSDQKVRLVLNGQEGTDHDVDMGIPQDRRSPPSFSPSTSQGYSLT